MARLFDIACPQDCDFRFEFKTFLINGIASIMRQQKGIAPDMLLLNPETYSYFKDHSEISETVELCVAGKNISVKLIISENVEPGDWIYCNRINIK